jgi:hypothetical protein
MRTATRVPSLVPPETHGWAYLAKWTLRVVVLLGVSLAMASQATAAPVVFKASGEFEDTGATLSGTLTIDTATGHLLSADLIIIDHSGDVVAGEYVFTTITSPVKSTTIRLSGHGPKFESGMQLTLPVSTLVGYKGGSIISGLAPAFHGASVWEILVEEEGYGRWTVDYLVTGSLEPQ